MSNEFIFETEGFGNESQFEDSSEFFEGEFEDEYLGEDEDEIRRGVPFRRPAYRPAARAINRPRNVARRPFVARRPSAARRPFARPGLRRPGTRFRSPFSLQRRHPNYGRRFPLRRSPQYSRRFPPPYPQPNPYPYPAPPPYSEQPPPPLTSTAPAFSGAPQAGFGSAAPPQAIFGGAPAPAPPQEGSEHVRVMQSLLNRALGLNLPVNGVLDTATRSAIRSFQGQNSDAAEPAPAEGGASEPTSQPPGDEQGAPQGESSYYDDNDAMNFRQRRRLRRGR
jgi:hypothetical protein